MNRLVVLLALLAACNCRSRESETSSSSQALASKQRVLDVSADGHHVLWGEPLAAPPDADPTLLHRVILRVDGKETKWDGPSPIQDARFLPDGSVAALDADDRLIRLHAGQTSQLDESVRPGFDVSSACSCLVYLRGDPFSSTPVVRDLQTGRVRSIDGEFAPAWQPVIESAGRAFVLVSSRSGVPALWRIPLDGGAPKQLTNINANPLDLTPFPEGPEHPLLVNDLLLFESRGVTHALGTDGQLRWSRQGWGVPHWERPLSTVRFEGSNRVLPVEDIIRAGGPR